MRPGGHPPRASIPGDGPLRPFFTASSGLLQGPDSVCGVQPFAALLPPRGCAGVIRRLQPTCRFSNVPLPGRFIAGGRPANLRIFIRDGEGTSAAAPGFSRLRAVPPGFGRRASAALGFASSRFISAAIRVAASGPFRSCAWATVGRRRFSDFRAATPVCSAACNVAADQIPA